MNVKSVAIVSLIACFAVPVFAGTAPVYDADAMIPYGNPADVVESVEPPTTTDAPAYFSQRTEAASPSPITTPETAYGDAGKATLSMAERLKRLEEQVQGVHQANAPSRVESLQNEVQVLRNQVEQLTHELEQAKSQQKLLYADVDKRLAESEAASKKIMSPPAVVAAKKKPVSTEPDNAEEQRIYQEAYNLIKAKKYAEAVKSLNTMLKKYPSGQFASNAHYWLGELYGLLGNHRQSLSEFETVVNDFPDSSRVSDAQLKMGLIYASQSNWQKAKLAFNVVTQKYSGTASATLAKEQLKQLKQAGH